MAWHRQHETKASPLFWAWWRSLQDTSRQRGRDWSNTGSGIVSARVLTGKWTGDETLQLIHSGDREDSLDNTPVVGMNVSKWVEVSKGAATDA